MQGRNGEANIVNRLVDIVREGEGGTNWESSTETYTLPYVKHRSNLLYEKGAQRGETWWEMRGRFKREETYIYLWLTHVDIWQKPTEF